MNFISTALWCSGSTTVFGAVSPGSSPGEATKLEYGVTVTRLTLDQ